MPESKPKLQVDLESLGLNEGAAVLLRRALGQLARGEYLEVRGNSAGLSEHLAAWCRKEGHRCGEVQGAPGTYRIEAGGAVALIATSRTEVCESAEPAWAR
jgi:TusA-related sulfurtransferase